jgi:hypothetical protein
MWSEDFFFSRLDKTSEAVMISQYDDVELDMK